MKQQKFAEALSRKACLNNYLVSLNYSIHGTVWNSMPVIYMVSVVLDLSFFVDSMKMLWLDNIYCRLISWLIYSKNSGIKLFSSENMAACTVNNRYITAIEYRFVTNKFFCRELQQNGILWRRWMRNWSVLSFRVWKVESHQISHRHPEWRCCPSPQKSSMCGLPCICRVFDYLSLVIVLVVLHSSILMLSRWFLLGLFINAPSP